MIDVCNIDVCHAFVGGCCSTLRNSLSVWVINTVVIQIFYKIN